MPYHVLLCRLLPLFTCRNRVHLPYMDSPSLQPQYAMSYVTSRMFILDDQPHQQMTLHFQLSLQYNISPIMGFIRLCHCCSLQFPSFHLCLLSPMCMYPVMTVLAYLLDDALCVSHMTWHGVITCIVYCACMYIMFHSYVWYIHTIVRLMSILVYRSLPSCYKWCIALLLLPSPRLLCNFISKEEHWSTTLMGLKQAFSQETNRGGLLHLQAVYQLGREPVVEQEYIHKILPIHDKSQQF